MSMPASLFTRSARGAALTALAVLSACSSWRVQQVGPERLVADGRPAQVRVRRPDGSVLVLRQPMLRNDSLLGQSAGDTTGVPLSDVSQVAVRRFDGLKTVGTVVLVTAVSAAVACAAGGCRFGPGFGTSAP